MTRGQDKIEGLTDYALAAAVSVPPTFSRDALRSTAAGMEADEQGTRVFDLYHVEGNKNLVPSNRRLQAVRIDVGWHDRSLKNVGSDSQCCRHDWPSDSLPVGHQCL
eukprot:754532-Hanusia_phi.AAC.4